MKLMLLLLFGIAFKLSVAQVPLWLTKTGSKNLTAPSRMNELPADNKHYIELYWRSETNRKIFTKVFNYKSAKPTANNLKEFIHFSKEQALNNINRIYLNTKNKSNPSQAKIDKFNTVLADVLDTFLGQYSISNKIIY